MRRYGIEEVRRVLAEVDARLSRPVAVTLIGGAAVALTLDDRTLTTKDIDAFGAPALVFVIARELEIPFDPAAVADLPWNYEDRCTIALRLTRLEVSVPDPHDLVLSKISRWSPSDQDHTSRLHGRGLLDYETLVERYRTEMTHAIGDPRRLRGHFLWCISDLFGEVARARAERRIPAP